MLQKLFLIKQRDGKLSKSTFGTWDLIESAWHRWEERKREASDGRKELSWAPAPCPAPQVTSAGGCRGQIHCQHGCHLPGPDVSHGTCCNADLELRDVKIKRFILIFNANLLP